MTHDDEDFDALYDEYGPSQRQNNLKVSYPEILLDEKFVLLGVSSRDDDEILRRNEPKEFLEPMSVAVFVDRHCSFHLGNKMAMTQRAS